jgi:two-component system response regulator AtoC
MRTTPLIFIVDDDAIILKLIEAELKALNLQIMSFSYGEECLSQIHLKPDLVILDYIFVKGDTPVLIGLEILKEIRNLYTDVPVIILSGQDSGNTVLELIKLGIEEYIIKDKDFISRLKVVINDIFRNG